MTWSHAAFVTTFICEWKDLKPTTALFQTSRRNVSVYNCIKPRKQFSLKHKWFYEFIQEHYMYIRNLRYKLYWTLVIKTPFKTLTVCHLFMDKDSAPFKLWIRLTYYFWISIKSNISWFVVLYFWSDLCSACSYTCCSVKWLKWLCPKISHHMRCSPPPPPLLLLSVTSTMSPFPLIILGLLPLPLLTARVLCDFTMPLYFSHS